MRPTLKSLKEIRQDFNDFTERHYKTILKKAKKNYKFVFYGERTKRPHIILRHDVDFSPHRALRIAQIEKEYGICSTFFVRLHSEFYNLFEKDIFEKVKKIIEMKHEIGLHFEAEFYPEIKDISDLRKRLNFEKKHIEKSFDIQINTFSFHNPDAGNMLRFDQEKIGSLYNAYSKNMKENYKYCSDSDGYWRYSRLFDVINTEHYHQLQILTHPEWWQKEPMSPKEKIVRTIEGRRKNQLKSYLKMLSSAGRKDVG